MYATEAVNQQVGLFGEKSQMDTGALEDIDKYDANGEIKVTSKREGQLSAYHELALMQVAPQLCDFTVSYRYEFTESNRYEFLVYIEKVRLKQLIRYS
jgi:hypothetical protein